MILIGNQELPSTICGRCGLKIFPAAAMNDHLARHRVLDGSHNEAVRQQKRRGRTPGVETTKRMGAIVKKNAPEIRIGKAGKNG